VPLFGLTMLAVLSVTYWTEFTHQTALLKRVAEQDLVAYERASEVLVDLTAQHLTIYDLLQGSNRPREEEALYDIGKRSLERIGKAVKALDQALPAVRSSDKEGSAKREQLKRSIQAYQRGIRQAITMSTVDLGRATEQFGHANQLFNSMNVTFAQHLAAERASIKREVADRVAQGERISKVVAAGGIAAAITLILLSWLAATLLSRSLERQIKALVALGDAAGTHLAVTGEDELDRVDQAVSAFGNVLEQLNATKAELEHRVVERTRQLAEANERLERMATHDRLTGLPAVMYVDLDRFKEVNDTMGHAAGDALLIAVSQRLANCVRACDTVARMGGDEFTAVLVQLASEDDAAAVASRVIESVQAPVNIGSSEVTVGASVGLAFFPRDGVDARTLSAHADQALYAAKQAGRGTFRVFGEEDPSRRRASARA
jgi:diguanylate cyclase (GGDEF)-like protein